MAIAAFRYNSFDFAVMSILPYKAMFREDVFDFGSGFGLASRLENLSMEMDLSKHSTLVHADILEAGRRRRSPAVAFYEFFRDLKALFDAALRGGVTFQGLNFSC